jgi:hypothetical protein
MKKIRVSNIDLYRVAAQELGDPLQWISIARRNNIVDPMIDSMTELELPLASPAFGDGIGPQ